MNRKVTIIDYNAGNLRSIVNMMRFLGVSCEITSDVDEIKNAQRIIFPGQGHFAQAMKNLKERNLVNTIKNVVNRGTPFLGICLGLQILFESSEEAPNVEGLCLLKGSVKKFKIGKTPQIGWNKIGTTYHNSFLSNDFFYFVNSYYVVPTENEVISSIATYHIDFCASIEKENLCAVQFHPEKSSDAGCEFFRNWLNKS